MPSAAVAGIVVEVTDDKSLGKTARKRLQIGMRRSPPQRAKLVKLADKICNLRDIRRSAAGLVADAQAGILRLGEARRRRAARYEARLERRFDQVYAKRP